MELHTLQLNLQYEGDHHLVCAFDSFFCKYVPPKCLEVWTRLGFNFLANSPTTYYVRTYFHALYF